MNILVIDPDPIVASQVRQLFAAQGEVGIEAAANGTDAWMILGSFKHRFDAVILELTLPDIDGLELLARIRRTPKHRDIPVLVCSAKPSLDLVVKVKALGVGHFVVKPAADEVLRVKLAAMAPIRSATA